MKKIYSLILLIFAAFPMVSAAEWTDWEDYARGTFDAKWWYRKPMENLQVMRRHVVGNDKMVQFKVCGMFGDTPGCDPVDLIIGVNFAVQGPTSRDVAMWVDDQLIESYTISGEKTDIYLCDGYTYYENYFPEHPEYAMQYEDASYYRPETGTFYIYSYYHYTDGTVPFLDAFYKDQAQGMETLTLEGPDFKKYTADFTPGSFEKEGDNVFYNCTVDINDLKQVKMLIAPGSNVDARTLANKMVDGLVEHTTVTESGAVKLPFDGTEGDNTLVYATYDASGNPYQIGQMALYYDPNWTKLGTATFTDGFISKFLETDLQKNLGLDLPEEAFTYPVEVEESTVTPGRYRLVNPYGATSPYWDIDFSNLKLNKKETNYLYINATDPEHVHIEYSNSGFYYGSEPLVLYSDAHDWLAEEYGLDFIPSYLWGKMDNKVIRFAAGTENDNILSCKILTSPAPIYGRELVIRLPGAPEEGITAVEASSDYPVEYYNLQGIRVANPSNGIFIRRQGVKSEKVVK